MTPPAITSPRRSFDLPKPEDGLSEWTSRIRALQQQVDADEEAEHRRLEEEIAASRLARMRRSRGPGYGSGSRTSSVDFSDRERSSRFGDDDGATSDDMRSISDRQRGQEHAMRKLMGSTSPPSSVSSASASPSFASSRVSSTSASSTRTEPMSLAQFMGGRGAGPRLKKHAPQQDAHDPTQFEQRTRITSPHPVFGKGGVAMPGMTKQPSMPSMRSHPSFDSDETSVRLGGWKKEPDLHSRSPVEPSLRERTSSSPLTSSSRPSSVASRYTDVLSERPLSPQKSGSRDRDRTMSIPNKPFPQSSSLSSSNGRKTPLKGEPGGGRVSPQKTGGRERTLSTPGRTSPAKVTFVLPADNSDSEDSYKKKRASLGSTSRPKTPTQDNKTFSHKPAVETPSLARTIQPQPRSPPNAPQISMSQNPSPAFLKPPASKGPTPSLSRLQGRGFVQNMVKATEVFQSPTQTTPDKNQPGNRKVSVLDRWQPQPSISPVPASPPPVSTKPMRKSWTTEAVDTSPLPQPPASKPLRSYTSFPSFKSQDENNRPFEREPAKALEPDMTGVGSATTLVVFKTVPTETDNTEFADVDELGMRSHRSASTHLGGKLPVHTGKPLIHPTRERARKPKKSSLTSASSKAQDTEPPTRRGDASSDRKRPLTPKEPEPLKVEQTNQVERKSSPQPSRVTPPSSNGTRVGRITDRWAEQPIIGIKPIVSRDSSQSQAPKPAGMVGRKPLPGLAATPSFPSTFGDRAVNKSPEASSPGATSSPSSPVPKDSSRHSPPTRHSRIPSTGNRATVMDIATVFELEKESTAAAVEAPEAPIAPAKVDQEPLPESEDPSQRLPTPSPSQLERRRSTFEKYSTPSLPPLREEATPTSTPAGTLARGAPTHKVLQEVFDNRIPEGISQDEKAAAVEISKPSKTPSAQTSKIIHLSHVDHPLPAVDYNALMKPRRANNKKNSDITTISVEVMIIQGSTLTSLGQDINIFHDTEVLAVVHRYKSKSSGLVATGVWGWFGRSNEAGERERAKLEELAKRYGTTMVPVHQYHEPADLMQVLGNQLHIRQGPRAHWSAENTALHRVQSKKGHIFIDELDINIKHLCSGFSYCLSILDTVYVWHGRGSIDTERKAALRYGRRLSTNVVELTQGVNDQEEEMFWIVIGEGTFASANYWQWKRGVPEVETRIWRIDASDPKAPVAPVESLRADDAQNAVHVIDCIWEYFVIVGRSARGKRADIRLGLAVATEMSSRVRHQRPYTPTVHTLVFPTQVPVDLCAHLREFDETTLNGNNIPDHMNILTKEDALDHLRRRSWEEFALRDPLMLPLGMDSHFSGTTS